MNSSNSTTTTTTTTITTTNNKNNNWIVVTFNSRSSINNLTCLLIKQNRFFFQNAPIWLQVVWGTDAPLAGQLAPFITDIKLSSDFEISSRYTKASFFQFQPLLGKGRLGGRY
jgi:hypothetical protein